MRMVTAMSVMCSLLTGSLLGQPLVPEPARPADDFADSIGVATHWSYTDTMYHQKWEQVQKLLGESGLRYVRDGLHPRLDWLYEQYGIRALILSEPNNGALSEQAAAWKSKRHLISAIEGPNEGNLFWVNTGRTYKDHGWPEGVRLYQNDLYSTVKNDEALKHIDVIAPSTAYLGVNRQLAPLSSFDSLVMHSYAGGEMPSQSLHHADFSNLRNALLILGRGATARPIVATESGYHTCLGRDETLGPAQAGITLSAHAKYIPRHVAEYFAAGVQRTIIYELGSGTPRDPAIEPEAAFGLLNQDATPKPAYYALRDLIRLTGEATWDVSQKAWRRPAATPSALAFVLSGAPASVHHVLLQRSDGTFVLLLWNEISSFSTTTHKDIENAPVPVTLELAAAADITIHRLGAGSPAPVQNAAVKSAALMVPDEVIVIEIRGAGASAGIAPAEPGPVAVESTGVSAGLSWKASPGDAGYWVTLNGERLGKATIAADGMANFRMERLVPATSYPVRIVAVSEDGAVSNPAHVTVTTRDKFPDLLVSSIAIEPANPKPGDTVKFKATVANRGSAPTEAGVVIGTALSVDGKVVCWSDTFKWPLAPGAEVQLTPNNGPAGATSWVMTPGMHRVTAHVDDVNRIAESKESNNEFSISVDDGTGPDAVVGDCRAVEREIGKPLVLEVTLKNQGTQPIAENTVIAITALDPSSTPPKALGYAVTEKGIPAGGETVLRIRTNLTVKDAAPIRVQLIADDLNRFPELDESNNTTEIEVR